MTDTRKKSPYVLRKEARRIVRFADDWPPEFSPVDLIYLLAQSKAGSVEEMNRLTFWSDTVNGDIEAGFLEVRHEPQAPKRIEMIVAPGASDETKALATHRANHPFFGECDAYYRYEPIPDKPYITRESARAWLSSSQIEPNELIAEWLRVGANLTAHDRPEKPAHSGTPAKAAPRVTLDDYDGPGLVAWQAVLMENWPKIAKHQKKPPARFVMKWLKDNGPCDTFPKEQGCRDSLCWRDLYGQQHTLTIRRLATVLSEWRRANKIPV